MVGKTAGIFDLTRFGNGLWVGGVRPFCFVGGVTLFRFLGLSIQQPSKEFLIFAHGRDGRFRGMEAQNPRYTPLVDQRNQPRTPSRGVQRTKDRVYTHCDSKDKPTHMAAIRSDRLAVDEHTRGCATWIQISAEHPRRWNRCISVV
jgi:hypothetical protein